MTAIYETRTPRDEWPDHFRTVVEMFEESDVEPPDRGAYHAQTRAPLRRDSENEYTWHVLFQPDHAREVWKIDGQPLKHEETAAGNDGDSIMAQDGDITNIERGRVEVYAALTYLGEMHSRRESWHYDDDRIEEQFDSITGDFEVTTR